MKRMNIEVYGIVQGVGFRPFIHKLVKEYNLKGWVKNTSTGVTIDVEGNEGNLFKFIENIKKESPKLAFIEEVVIKMRDELKYYKEFKIIKSSSSVKKFTLISPDVCTCEDCIKELFDKNNRRYKFPFINCTNCGPRFTIIKDMPYDRKQTTMEIFPMCSNCFEEYTNIEDRRYHAQPNSCYECGPELFFTNKVGEKMQGDPVENARNCLIEGNIIAVKGLGGFHVACDAKNKSSVQMIRERKHRDEKPFALMCRDMETVEKWCFVSDKEREIIMSFKRPIVLLKKKSDDFNYISPDNDYLGIMLPYTPVHYLLLEEQIDTLVMTSGNISDTPIVHNNREALKELAGIADGFLMNNRDINTRCDDSLVRVFENKEYPIRRSRGYVPYPIKINKRVGQILGCGVEQKATFAITKENYIFPSQYIGDLKNIETLTHYEEQIIHFKRMFDIEPEIIVCDLHPDYMSTQYAIDESNKSKLPLVFVQHHHAHLASCMVDNNLTKKVLGIIWDGTGYGTDGGIWGGEFLIGDFKGFERVGSIRPIKLPGGDRATKEIYRIGYSQIIDSLDFIPENLKLTENSSEILDMIKSNFNCPPASSMGRLFDGIGAILGLKSSVSYEGQCAIILENSAADTEKAYTYTLYEDNGMIIFDWRPLVREIVAERMCKGMASAKFMNTLVAMALDISLINKERTGISNVVLSGGVFQNMYLLKKIKQRLESNGFNVYHHSRVSTNDEGIALGQVMIAEYGGGVNVSGNTFKNSRD